MPEIFYSYFDGGGAEAGGNGCGTIFLIGGIVLMYANIAFISSSVKFLVASTGIGGNNLRLFLIPFE
jgi:hypothetical protein